MGEANFYYFTSLKLVVGISSIDCKELSTMNAE